MLSTPVGDPHELAGYREAVAALEQAGGVLLAPEAARAFALVVLHVTGPAVRAELLADLADDLDELAHAHRSAALAEVSHALDRASLEIRRALEVRA